MMLRPEPIYTVHLFPEVNRSLIDLLECLGENDWEKPTICSSWNVKDIATHILDGNLRRLSFQRDNHQISGSKNSFSNHVELVDFLNSMNAKWVAATKRLSPRIITRLLEESNNELYDFFKTLDPFAEALFPVSWTGEAISLNWFDIAREFSEKWLHQQQIRLATNKPGIMDRKYYYPVLDTFMRALPYTYRNVESAEETLIRVTIEGEAGGRWFLIRQNEEWILVKEAHGNPLSEVSLHQDIAWQVFSKGISSDMAEKAITIKGDKELGKTVLQMVSVMA